jgi:hypothetical protein
VSTKAGLNILGKRTFSCPCHESNTGLGSTWPRRHTDYTMMAPELKRGVEIKVRKKTVKLSIFPGMGRWEIKLFCMATLPSTTEQSKTVYLLSVTIHIKK